MGKIWIEVSMMSARGLQRTSSLWKLQWYAVGWIDPNDKYCTKIDSSGNVNPVWKTKFSALVDSSKSDFQDLALHVEVYSREPIFLREKLLGTATILLKEFLEKYANNSEASRSVEEVGSFQLRKKNSNKPQGFIDISIRISGENEEHSTSPSEYGGFKLADHSNGINLANEYGPPKSYLPSSSSSPAPLKLPENHPPANGQYANLVPIPQQPSPATLQLPENRPPATTQYPHPTPIPTNYYHPSIGGPSYPSAGGPSHQPPWTPLGPPPPPLHANVGYLPTFLPGPNNMSSSYINMPSNGAAPARGRGALGFGAGLGVGALAAGSMIYGNDFMSGFDLPSGLQGASLTISTDPPF